MATSGIIYGNSSKSWQLKIEWSRTDYSIPNNTSTIALSLYVYNGNNAYNKTGTAYYTLDGTKTFATFDFPSTKAWRLLGTKTITLSHEPDGSKKYTVSGEWYSGITSSSYTPKSLSVSGEIILDTIPRYATSVQSLINKTETDITMSWSSDSTIDYMWYSTDNGSNWVGKAVSNVGSGSYTISGLKANTTYKIITRVRKKESQLTTDSAVLSVDTYNFPNCNSTPDFTLGNSVSLGFYNPLNRAFKFYVIGNGKQIATEYSGSGTSYKGLNDAEGTVAQLYETIPNARSGTYKVKVVYGDSAITTDNGNTFSIKGTEVPSLGSVSYADNRDASVNVTKDNQLIIQNQSNVLVSYTEATAKNSAKIENYTFTLNETTKTSTSPGGTVDFGRVNSSSDLVLTMTATDSRGLSATTSIPVSVVAYQPPSAVVTLERKNNYEDETYLTVDATVTDINGNNAYTITYGYKAQKDSSFGGFNIIKDKEVNTLQLDKNEAYTFRVALADSLYEGVWVNEYPLGKGVFPLFINTEKNQVGINDFPQDGEALRVASGDVRLVDGKIRGDQNRILWQGMELMDENTTIELAEKISNQLMGVFLVFSLYADTENGRNVAFNYHFIPKVHTLLHEGKGVVFRISGGTPFKYQGSKYLYISDDKIKGNSSNIEVGTADSGVTYTNNIYALRYVIGV